ncbi:peptidylprolyl isomerase [Paenibacillus sp. HB172176]|uniref:peptidylprolyl isomerase n=1 Tax=Paenibacillus sp. HB172176 TaxID=2493690 RepID=UPI00143B213E|nr:peptidylprolyl isomerase [Paenibacillus sp. HB172176]
MASKVANNRIRCLFILMMALMALLAGCGSSGSSKASDEGVGQASLAAKSWDRMPEMELDLNKSYSAMVSTDKGDFTIELFAKQAPITVNNFVFLANNGFYDGFLFETVIESFMIQTGDPLQNGLGNAGYRIPDELDTGLSYEEGIVAMFNGGKPNSGSSQFFICTGPEADNLNSHPNYSIFGRVKEGYDVIRKIAETPVKNDKPIEDIHIFSIRIMEE